MRARIISTMVSSRAYAEGVFAQRFNAWVCLVSEISKLSFAYAQGSFCHTHRGQIARLVNR